MHVRLDEVRLDVRARPPAAKRSFVHHDLLDRKTSASSEPMRHAGGGALRDPQFATRETTWITSFRSHLNREVKMQMNDNPSWIRRCRGGALLTAGAVSVALLTAFASAQSGRSSQSSSNEWNKSSRSMGSDSWNRQHDQHHNSRDLGWTDQQGSSGFAGLTTFSGWVRDFRQVRLDEFPDHNFVRIQLDDGRTKIVDLGPEVDLDALDLRRDAWVNIRGRTTNVDGEQVIAATTVYANGESIPIASWIDGDSSRSSGYAFGRPQFASSPRSSGGEKTLQGRVEQVREVELEGQPNRHTLVSLRLDNGQSKIVDLGPRLEPDQINLEPGADVAIRGFQDRIEGHDVLVATNVRADGQSFETGNRTFSSSQSRARNASSSSSYEEFGSRQQGKAKKQSSLQGRVESVREVEIEGQDDQHTLVSLRLENGQSKIVDLGPRLDLEDIDLEEGSNVAIRGFPGRIDGRSVLMATSVRVDGESFEVDPSFDFQSRDRQMSEAGAQRDTSWYSRPQSQRDSWTDMQDDYRQSSYSSSSGQQGERSTFRGRLEDFERVDMPGMSDSGRTLVRLRLQDGRSRTVDIGSAQVIDRLEEGRYDTIEVEGRLSRVGNRQVLMAEELTIDGRPVQIAQAGRDSSSAREASSRRPQETKQVSVRAANMQFTPETMTVQPGQQIRVTLQNEGNEPYSFECELPDGEIGLQYAVSRGESNSIEFTAPQREGTYTFYCPIDDHRDQGMEGRLIVRRSQSSQNR
jgi:plastocyanin